PSLAARPEPCQREGIVMSPELGQELQRLLSCLCDDNLNDAEHVRLEELLGRDEECRRMYLDYMDMHARFLASGATGEPPLDTAAAGRATNRSGVPPALRYVLVATTTLAA